MLMKTKQAHVGYYFEMDKQKVAKETTTDHS